MNHTEEEGLFLGIDVGAVSANTIIMDAHKKHCRGALPSHSKVSPMRRYKLSWKDIFSRILPARFLAISFVGTGGKLLSHLLNAHFSNEIIAQCKAIEFLHPQVRTGH